MWAAPVFEEFDIEELIIPGSNSIGCDRHACWIVTG